MPVFVCTSFPGHQCLEDLLRIVFQAVVFQVDHNVTQRSPYIRRNQIDHMGHRR